MGFGAIGMRLAVAGIVCCAMPADAAGEKGVVAMPKNRLTVNGDAIQLKYFRALLHDNAEGLLDMRRELRILITDREVPTDALEGLAMLPVLQMARDGKVQGLLIKLDPDDTGVVYVTLLHKPVEPQVSLMTQTLSSSNKDLIRNFKVTGGFVAGSMERNEDGNSFFADMPTMGLAIDFNIPLDDIPAITSNMKGSEARKSVQAAMLVKRGDALMRKDFALLRTIVTDGSYRRSEALLSNPAFQEILPEMGAEIKKSADHISRLIVRGNRAVIAFDDNSWNEFSRENGEWKFEN